MKEDRRLPRGRARQESGPFGQSGRQGLPFSAMRSLLLLSILAASLGLVGCAGGKDAADKHFSEMQGEITRLQAEQDRLSERLGEVEAQARAKGGSSSSVARPPLEVVVLRPEGAPPAEAVAEPTEEGPRTTVRATGRGDVGEATDSGRSRGAKADARGKAEAQKDYEQALSLVKKKQYGKAIEALTGFLVRYPDDARAENAMFWMGEAYLGQGDSPRALEQFQSVVSRFPDGNKAPDSLLKIAVVQKKLGDDVRSKEALATLKSRFPSSEAARRAPKE